MVLIADVYSMVMTVAIMMVCIRVYSVVMTRCHQDGVYRVHGVYPCV
jgi:hypothetical protein